MLLVLFRPILIVFLDRCEKFQNIHTGFYSDIPEISQRCSSLWLVTTAFLTNDKPTRPLINICFINGYWASGDRTCIFIEKLKQEQNKSDEFPALKKPVRHGRYGIINSQLCSFDRSVWSALFMAMLTVRNVMSRAEICPLSILFQFFRYRHLSALVNHIKYRIDDGALPLIVIIQGVGDFCLD